MRPPRTAFRAGALAALLLARTTAGLVYGMPAAPGPETAACGAEAEEPPGDMPGGYSMHMITWIDKRDVRNVLVSVDGGASCALPYERETNIVSWDDKPVKRFTARVYVRNKRSSGRHSIELLVAREGVPVAYKETFDIFDRSRTTKIAVQAGPLKYELPSRGAWEPKKGQTIWSPGFGWQDRKVFGAFFLLDD